MPETKSNLEEIGLKFEYDTLLEEYKAIRSELQAHLTNQDQLVSYAMALIALLITVGQYVTDKFGYVSPLVFLGASVVFASLSLMFIRYDTNVAVCSGYITWILKPRIEALIVKTTKIQTPVLLWESTNIRLRFHGRHAPINYLLTGGRHSILIIPSVGILTAYLLTRDFSRPVQLWENTILGLSIIANIIVCISMFSTAIMFSVGNPKFEQEIKEQKPSKRKKS